MTSVLQPAFQNRGELPQKGHISRVILENRAFGYKYT